MQRVSPKAVTVAVVLVVLALLMLSEPLITRKLVGVWLIIGGLLVIARG